MAMVDAIKKLHASMIDTRRAYEKAHTEADEPQLKALFADMVALKEKDHQELHRLLTDMDEEPNEDGSFMTTVHKAVILVRSAIKGVDRDALSAFASGEKSVVKEHDNALEQGDIPPATFALLARQKSALLAKIARMESMGKASDLRSM